MNQTHTYDFLTKSVTSLSGVGDKTKKLLKRKKIEKITGNYDIGKALYDYIKRNESGS